MDIVNLGFGFIGVLSFGYAIWQNREAASAKRITQRVTQTICQLAKEISSSAVGTPAEGYASSIVRVARSLLDEPALLDIPEFGSVSLEYHAVQLRSRMGALSEISDSVYGYVLSGTFAGNTWDESTVPPGTPGRVPRDSVLVYGPYHTLPMTGKYTADFRIRRASTVEPVSIALLRLDVYCHEVDRVFSWRHLTIREVLPTWITARLEFEYTNLDAKLEYRISIMEPGVEVMFEYVTVAMVSS